MPKRPRRWIGRSVYRVILMTYVAMLLLTVLFWAIFMRSAETLLSKETEKAHGISIEMLYQRLEESIQSAQTICSEYASNSSIGSLLYKDRATRTPKNGMDIVELADNLYATQINNPYVKRIYCLFLNGEFVVSNEGKYSLDEFYESCSFDESAYSREDMVEDHSRRVYQQFLHLKKADGGPDQLVYLYSLPISNTTPKRACLGVELDTGFLVETITNEYAHSELQLFIVDERHRPISLGVNDAALMDGVDWNGYVEGRSDRLSYGGQEYLVTVRRSGTASWHYITLVPMNQYMNTIREMSRHFLILLGCMLLMGGVLAIVFSRRQYAPIRRLMKLADADQDKQVNEYAALESNIVHIKQQNMQLQSENKLHSEQLRKQQLLQILRGGYADAIEIEEILRKCGMKLGFERFTVAMIPGKGQAGSSGHAPVDRDSEIEWVDVDDDENIYLILNCAQSVDRGALSAWLTAWIAELTGNRVMPRALAVGGDYPSVDQLHEAYLDVQAVEEYLKLTGIGGAFFVEDLPDATPMGEVTQWIKEQKLINGLKAGQFDEAEAVFDQIIDQMLNGNMTKQAIKCNMYGLIYALSRAVTDNSFIQLNGNEEIAALANHLVLCEDIQSLKETMHELLKRLKTNRPQARDDRMDAVSIAEEAISIIQQRYADQMLSVAGVAEQINITPVALTRAFKKVLNMGVLDYIHHSRIHVAKQLLINTDENIANIAQRTGYNNNVTFIRVFKKYEGVTPGQYRAANGGE